jgi:hypothetical protein
MSGNTNFIGLPINSSSPLTTLNGGIGRSVTPTVGSVLFYDSTGVQQNNTNLFWDNTNDNLYIAANSSSQAFQGIASLNIQSPTGTSWKNGINIYSTLDQWPILTLFGFEPNTGSIFFDAYTNGNNTYTSSSSAGNYWIQGAGTSMYFYYASGYAAGANITWNVGMSLSNAGIINIPNLTASKAVVTDSSKNLVSLAYTNLNTASTLVERDSSGNFSAGTITAALSGNATTATTATNATNVATTQASANSSYYPLMVSSSTNSNQAVDLGTGWTFNPNTNTLNTSVLQASGSLQVGTTTNSGPLTLQGNGGTTGPNAVLAMFTSPSSPAAGNLFIVQVSKTGTEVLLLGINKNTVTGGVPANTAFISTYIATNSLSIGRGDGTGLPSTSDILIDGSGNVNIKNGNLNVSNLTASELVVTDGSKNLASSNTLSATVLGNIAKVTTTSLVAGSGTYIPPANCTHIRVRIWGAGGGSGGVAGAVSSGAGAGGGGGGAYVETIIINPSAGGYAYSLGSAGSAGATGANNGGTGSATTFGTLTANGGAGGNGATASLSASITAGGLGGTGSGGLINITGSDGGLGLSLSASLPSSGTGGGSPGGGGMVKARSSGTAPGLNGYFPGGGASGAVTNGSTSEAGGTGAAPLIFIEEYYNG